MKLKTDPGSWLIIGLSGTGKTTLAKKIHESTNKSKKPGSAIVINGGPDDYPPNGYKHVDYDNLGPKPPISAIFWDDISLPSPSELKILRRLLIFHSRHDKIAIYCIMHSVQSNNSSGLINHFHNVIFTHSPSNRLNFHIFCARIAKDVIDSREKADSAFDQFLTRDKSCYIHFDSKSRVFSIRNRNMKLVTSKPKSSLGTGKADEKLTILRGHVQRFLVSDDRQTGLILFEYVFQTLSPSVVTDDFLFKIKDGGVDKSCLILDILSICSSNREPTATEKCVFQALKSEIRLPRSLIRNPKIQELL